MEVLFILKDPNNYLLFSIAILSLGPNLQHMSSFKFKNV